MMDIVERIEEMKDNAYDVLFAEKLELERKRNFWRGLFVVTACILGAIAIGCVVYTLLKRKLNNKLIANLKSRFSREVDDLDFIDLASDDVSVDVID